MSSEKIYKPNDFYRIRDRGILKDGHSMLVEDVVNDLNNYRRGYLKLQEENKRLRAALEVYADEYKWSESQRYWFDVNDCFKLHGYKIAQEALNGE